MDFFVNTAAFLVAICSSALGTMCSLLALSFLWLWLRGPMRPAGSLELTSAISSPTHVVDDATYQTFTNAVQELGTIRLRNLLNYKERKHGMDLTSDESLLVSAGNRAAHDGNCRFDAFILTHPRYLQHPFNGDANKSSYYNLYGMDATEVLRHADNRVLVRALDQMGTIENRAHLRGDLGRRYVNMRNNFEAIKAHGLGIEPIVDSEALESRSRQMLHDYKHLKRHAPFLKAGDKFLAKEWRNDNICPTDTLSETPISVMATGAGTYLVNPMFGQQTSGDASGTSQNKYVIPANRWPTLNELPNHPSASPDECTVIGCGSSARTVPSNQPTQQRSRQSFREVFSSICERLPRSRSNSRKTDERTKSPEGAKKSQQSPTDSPRGLASNKGSESPTSSTGLESIQEVEESGHEEN